MRMKGTLALDHVKGFGFYQEQWKPEEVRANQQLREINVWDQVSARIRNPAMETGTWSRL